MITLLLNLFLSNNCYWLRFLLACCFELFSYISLITSHFGSNFGSKFRHELKFIFFFGLRFRPFFLTSFFKILCNPNLFPFSFMLLLFFSFRFNFSSLHFSTCSFFFFSFSYFSCFSFPPLNLSFSFHFSLIPFFPLCLSFFSFLSVFFFFL